MIQSLLAEFCVRLAAGLACMMICTSGRSVGVQFFRTLMLVVLGLAVFGILIGPGLGHISGLVLLGSAVLAFIGSVVWTLGRLVGGQAVSALLFACTAIALLAPLRPSDSRNAADCVLLTSEAATSALVLGSMTAAMLLGHSYLIAPAMSIEPLKRLVLWIGGSLAARAAVAMLELALVGRGGAAGASIVTSSGLWWTLLVARWLIGLVGPAIMACMVWQTTRIRSTQSATGILYAGVILIFFGELVDEMLSSQPALAM